MSLSIEQEFEAYKAHITRYPNALILDDYINGEYVKWHIAGRDTFAAVCTLQGAFRRLITYIPLH